MPAACAQESDATPAQLLPKSPPDPTPHEDDLEKHPDCPYCGMDRRYNHRARMLTHYGNNAPRHPAMPSEIGKTGSANTV